MKKKVIWTLLLLFLIPVMGGCETLYTGKGYAVHDDKEAMDFAWVWFNKKNYDTAERTANLALNINPENVDAYNLLGIIALKKGNYKDGVERLEKSIYLVKKNNAPHAEYMLNNLGFAYYNNLEYKKALESFESAFKIKESWISSFGAAISLYKLGGKEKAMAKITNSKNEIDFLKKAREILEYFNVHLDNEMVEFLELQ